MTAFTEFMPDVVINGIAGFLGSLSIVYLRAALTGTSYAHSQKAVFRHLDELAGTLPKELQVLVAKYMGYFGAFVLIILLSLAFGYLGKLVAPPLSAAFAYFGDREAKLWVEQRDKIFSAEERLQETANLSTVQWQTLQDGLGRYPVRTSRALIPFTCILVVAGLADSFRSAYRKRGMSLLVAGVLFFFLSTLMWSNFQGDYVRQLRVAYRRVIHDNSFPN